MISEIMRCDRGSYIENKRPQRELIARQTAAWQIAGNRITEVPFGASALMPDGHTKMNTWSGHTKAEVNRRAKRAQYGR